jgi:hypothetical protein
MQRNRVYYATILPILVLLGLNFPSLAQMQTQTQPGTQTQEASGEGKFEADVSGFEQLKLEGQANWSRSPGGDLSISLAAKETADSPPRTVLLILPGGIKPGTYEIKAYEHAFTERGRVSMPAATFSSNEIIGLNAAGTLNLTETGSVYSGTFEFTTESYDKKQNITVKGSFDHLTEKKFEKPEKKHGL